MCNKCQIQNCLSCDPPGKSCNKCSNDLVLQDNVCVKGCKSGFYKNLNNVCTRCSDVNCLDC